MRHAPAPKELISKHLLDFMSSLSSTFPTFLQTSSLMVSIYSLEFSQVLKLGHPFLVCSFLNFPLNSLCCQLVHGAPGYP